MRPLGLLFPLALVTACGAPPDPHTPTLEPDLALEASGPPRPKPSKYCASFHQRDHAPYCTWEVGAETLDKVGGYELSYYQGRLQKACLRGIHAMPAYPDDLDCIVYQYDGRLRRARGLTEHGRILWETRVSPGGDRLEYWDGYGRRRADQEEVFGERLEFDARGRVVARAFLDAQQRETSDALGRYQLRYSHDERGEITEMQALDRHGTPHVDDRGVGVERYLRSERGGLKELHLLDAERKPVNADGSYQLELWERDRYERWLEDKRFAADGSPAKFPKGHTVQRLSYRKARREDLFLDERGEPFRGWLGASRLVSHFDELGRPKRLEAFHLGRYVQEPGAFSVLDMTRGPGYVDRWFYGKDKKLVRGRPARSHSVFSADDFHTETSYFGSDGKPALFGKVARFTRRYVDGKLAEERSYGVNGQLLEKGIAVSRYTYDDNGRIQQRWGFDRDGKDLRVIAFRMLAFDIVPERNDDAAAAKQAAVSRALEVRQRIVAGMSFTRAYRTFDELRTEETQPQVHVEPHSSDSMLEGLALGEISQPIEWRGAVRLYQRVP